MARSVGVGDTPGVNVEVVAVGTELLLGQIVDTNSSWIGEQLAAVGLNSHYQTKVGDNPARIEATLRQALDRSDAVICCGGLGPTQDDLTRDVIATVMGSELILNDELAARIEEMFTSRGRTMPMNNLRQAEVPAGATPMAQMPGTAPGLVCPVGDKVIYAVPGVPYEMKEMIAATVVPDLRRRAGRTGVIASRVLRTWGTSESGLAELLADRISELDEIGNPTLAFLASGVEGLKVRITAAASDPEAASVILDDEEARLRALMGPIVFGVDDDNMEVAVLRSLAREGLTLAVAESITGGYVAGRVVAAPGASQVFRGGIVAYDPEVKFDLLAVPRGPVVTEAAALAMAQGVRARLGADVGLASTGVAGPDPSEGHPPGTVVLAVATPDAEIVRQVRMPGDRERIRQFSTITLLDMLRRHLDGV